MILGSFSFSPDVNTERFVERIRQVTDSGGLVFHTVTSENFIGGYYLNNNLPYTTEDIFFNDKAADMFILMSGIIYNKAELSGHLNLSESVPDPDLVARLFQLDGPSFVARLNGDFTIFIYKPSIGQAYLFRDHLGVRPVAFSYTDRYFCFSSDIIGLCRALSGAKPADSEFLLAYFKYVDYRGTPDNYVRKLLPGHFIHLSEKGIKITRYWEPEKIIIDRKLKYDRLLSDLKDITSDAIKIRCDSRFTAGAHVTGGLDSGLISTIARKEFQGQSLFYGFSWSPKEFSPASLKYDERDLIVKLCEKTDIRPVFSDMNSHDFQRYVSAYYSNQGYFSEDRTSDQAAALKTNLIFSGWGGDEFISTGDRGIEMDLLRRLKLKTFFRRNHIARPRKFLRYLLLYVIFPLLGILDSATARAFRDDARYIKKHFKRSDRKALRNFYFHSSRRQMHLRLLQFYHLQERCESWAVNGYRKGVEYRYPLLDRRIIEYMLRVSSELLCKTDHFRPLLRLISEGVLPEEIRWQLDKSDPVCWSYMDELFKESAGVFIEEVEEWKTNSDLYFVDFGLLSEDIERYRKSPDSVETNVLYRTLVYLKAIHEFTKRYHNDQ